MYLLYSVCLFLFFCLYLPWTCLYRRLIRREKIHLLERMGMRPPRPAAGRTAVWIHAVSVGEILSLSGLLDRLKRDHPSWIVYVSTLTATGLAAARAKLTAADRIFLMPFDFACILKSYFKRLRPEVLVLTESEFWPNLLRVAESSTRSVLLINGRMSKASHRKYRKVRFLIERLLVRVDRFLVQTEFDRDRFLDVGARPERMEIAGNLKAEIDLPRFPPEEVEDLKRGIGVPPGSALLVAGSTHRGEEETLLQAYLEARPERPGLKLILAPRHPHRAGDIETAARALGLTVRRRTAIADTAEWEIFILDTIGELARFYAMCDTAFVGGSLIPHGGQNLLEPAFYARPVFFGPHMENFAALADLFLERGAARVVRRGEELRDMFLMENPGRLEEMGRKARETLVSLQGALDRNAAAIERAVHGSHA